MHRTAVTSVHSQYINDASPDPRVAPGAHSRKPSSKVLTRNYRYWQTGWDAPEIHHDQHISSAMYASHAQSLGNLSGFVLICHQPSPGSCREICTRAVRYGRCAMVPVPHVLKHFLPIAWSNGVEAHYDHGSPAANKKVSFVRCTHQRLWLAMQFPQTPAEQYTCYQQEGLGISCVAWVSQHNVYSIVLHLLSFRSGLLFVQHALQLPHGRQMACV